MNYCIAPQRNSLLPMRPGHNQPDIEAASAELDALLAELKTVKDITVSSLCLVEDSSELHVCKN